MARKTRPESGSHVHDGHRHADGGEHHHVADGHRHVHGGEHHHGHDRHRNPTDLARYLARLEAADRAEWQVPDRVVKALRLQPGDTVCDIGVGPGYFALRMARAVGDRGTVYAIDVEPRMLAVLRERMLAAGTANVRPLLATGARGALPPRRCDLVLVVNTFHHFPDGSAYLRRLAGRLAPGGRIANIDFHKRELPVGPPPEHKVDRDEFLAVARRAGLELAKEHHFLRHQYFLELVPAAPARKPVRGPRRRPAGPPHRDF